MKIVMCKECGYSIDKKEPGNYYCQNCAKDMKFYLVQAFCGAKPDNGLYSHENDKIKIKSS